MAPPTLGESLNAEQLKSISIISIQVLNIIHAYPAVQDKRLFNEYFEISAQQATSKEVLHALLTTSQPTDILIKNIIEHPLFDDSLTRALFELKINCTEEIMLILIRKCTTGVQFDTIIKQSTLSQTVLLSLLGQRNLSESHLLQILRQTKSDVIIKRVGTHQAANKNVRETVFRHPLLSPSVVLTLLNKQSFTDDEIQLLLKHPTAITKEVSKQITRLSTMKHLQSYLKISSPKKPFLMHLSSKEFACVEEFLGISITPLYKPRGLKPPTLFGLMQSSEQLKSITLISIQVLNIIYQYPAFQDKRLFNEYFERSAQEATSKDVLYDLINTSTSTDTLILNIIKHPLFDESLMTSLLELKTDISEDTLLIIFGKCKTSAHFDLLIKQSNLTAPIITTLLGQKHLTDAHLLQILARAKSDVIIELVSTHQAVNQTVRATMFRHPLLSPSVLLTLLNYKAPTNDELLLILKHPTAITPDLLKHIMATPSIGSNVLLALILHNKTSDELILAAMSHNAFSREMAEKITELEGISPVLLKQLAVKVFDQCTLATGSEWEECLKKVFVKSRQINAEDDMIALIEQKRAGISAQLGFKIVNHFGQNVLKYLPISEMINIANEQELGQCIHFKTNLSSADIMAMAKKTKNTLQIDALLAHTKMTSELANTLFQKAEYGGKIANWDWLTVDQLQSTLEKTRDYDSVKIAIAHLNLSDSALEHCCNKMIEQQSQIKISITESPQKKLIAALDKLKIKAITHAIKAKNNEQYEVVAKTAFILYQRLYTEIENHFNNPAPNSKQFKARCQDAIEQAKPVLQVHRGYKQVLVDIVNVLFIAVALFKKGTWRFFEVDTASMKTVNEVSESIEESIRDKRAR